MEVTGIIKSYFLCFKGSSFKNRYPNAGNRMNCTVSGVKTTSWQSKDWYSMVNCGRPDISFRSIAGPRTLCFYIALNMGTGAHPILSYTPPYSYCGQNYITVKYDLGNTHFPVSGTIIITKPDAIQRKMEADFLDVLSSFEPSFEIQLFFCQALLVPRWLSAAVLEFSFYSS